MSSKILNSALSRTTTQEYLSFSVSEHKRILGKLAFIVQKKEYRGRVQHKNNPIHQKQDEIRSCLPSDWLRLAKDNYLEWIEENVHLMTRHGDNDNYAFCHKSFQEFLAAFYLDCKYEGAARKRKFLKLCKNESWWTTLELWADLINYKNEERVNNIIKKL